MRLTLPGQGASVMERRLGKHIFRVSFNADACVNSIFLSLGDYKRISTLSPLIFVHASGVFTQVLSLLILLRTSVLAMPPCTYPEEVPPTSFGGCGGAITDSYHLLEIADIYSF